MRHEPISERARGRWKSIISILGLADLKAISGRHSPCPFCGGKDRFRFDDRDGRGTFICSHCGAGDGVEFVKRSTGLDFKGAVARIETVIGKAAREAPPPQRSEREQREAMNELWSRSVRVGSGDIVARYLASRGIALQAFPSALRFCDRVKYSAGPNSTWLPAMIAKVSGPDGAPVQVHRTYLAPEGGKASVDCPRRLMPGTLPKGSAVRLGDLGEELGIAEGLETALAASILFGLPVWAGLNAGNMAGWIPPLGVQRVVIFGDHDENFVGQSAAFTLAARIAGRGARAEVMIPNTPGDWNDQLLATRRPANSPVLSLVEGGAE